MNNNNNNNNNSPECELSYQVKEIQSIFVVLQHDSPTYALLNQAREMHDMFEHGFLFV
jgi:hypothetical protein